MNKRTIWIRVPGFSFRWDRPQRETMQPEQRQTVILTIVSIAGILVFFALFIFGLR